MQRATSIVRKLAVKPDQIVDQITLDHRRRGERGVLLMADGGMQFRLELPLDVVIKGGDAVRLEDGRLVLVQAQSEPLLEIRAESATRLARIAWQIGSGHGVAEFADDAIYVASDPGVTELARGLGGRLTEVMRTFEPERTIAACGHDHHGHDHHGHGHSHNHADGHNHDHHDGHRHDHGHAHDHHGHAPSQHGRRE